MDAPASGRTGPAALADFIALNEEIAALVRARVPLEPHLARLGAELPGSAAKLAERIGGRLAAGDSLAAAMDAECTSLPAAYRAVIVAGAESGDLGSALESLVDTATRLDQMRRITGVALLYPLFVFVLVCLLIALIVSQVVPQFNWLHRSHFGLLPRLANSPLAVATIAIVLPIVALLIAAFWWRRSGRIHGNGTEQWGVLSRLPWIWRAQYWGHAATMADLLRLLIERGVPLDRAVCLAADATDDSQIRSGGRTAVRTNRAGKLWSVDARRPSRIASHWVPDVDPVGPVPRLEPRTDDYEPGASRRHLSRTGHSCSAVVCRLHADSIDHRHRRNANGRLCAARILALYSNAPRPRTVELEIERATMGIYDYVATTSTGERTSGHLAAADLAGAKQILSDRGLRAVELTLRSADEISATLGNEQSALFVHAVGTAAASRVPLEVTLSALAEERDDPHLAEVARHLSERLHEGESIADAVATLGHALPAEVLGVLRAGVESGDLAGAVEQFAQQRIAAQRIKRQIRSAIAYPLVIFSFLVPIALFLSLYVIPTFGASIGISIWISRS